MRGHRGTGNSNFIEGVAREISPRKNRSFQTAVKELHPNLGEKMLKRNGGGPRFNHFTQCSLCGRWFIPSKFVNHMRSTITIDGVRKCPSKREWAKPEKKYSNMGELRSRERMRVMNDEPLLKYDDVARDAASEGGE